MSERESFLKRWEQEQEKFERVLEAVPAGRLDYRPHEKSRSAGELVTLLAREQEMVVGLLDTGRVQFEQPKEEPLEAMKTLWRENTARVRERLHKLDDSAWDSPVKFMMGARVGNELPMSEMLWGFLLDMVHHRGQLSTYIRPMGGKVPSIYGPSADAGPQ